MLFPGIGPQGQRRLLASRVVLVGCGADGTAIADRLVRAGVGSLTIVDRDFIELSNLQRQVLYDEDDLAQDLPKAVAAARKLGRINSQVQVEGVVAHLGPQNGEELLAGADLVMDGTDNFETRYLINDICIKLGIPWVYCGVVSSYGMTMTIIPHQTPCLRCVFPETPPPESTAVAGTHGILNTIVTVLGGIAASEGIKLLVGEGHTNPGIIHVDLWENSFDSFQTGPPHPDCPVCALSQFEHLDQNTEPLSAIRCGHDAVQILPAQPVSFSLQNLADRLRDQGHAPQVNRHRVRFQVRAHDVFVFSDGRAIIKGTTDQEAARSLYSRFIAGGE
jgi:adenylyltransferase/sulfurtransferase